MRGRSTAAAGAICNERPRHRTPTLIAELIVTAEAAQRLDRVAHWKQVVQDVERASATLNGIDDE